MLQKPKPKWWQLYALVPLMVGLLVLEAQAPFPPIGHQFLQTGTLLVIFGLMALWVRANQAALTSQDQPNLPHMELIESMETMRLNLDPLQLTNWLEYSTTSLGEFDPHSSKGRYN